jgi:hypothetical protein
MISKSCRWSCLSLATVFALSACGGGGGGSPTPPPPPPPPDSEPDAFVVASIADAPRGSGVDSAAITIQGVNVPVAVSVAGGEYSIDGGAFTSAPGTVNNGQHVAVRTTASPTPGGTVEATLTIGGVSSAFSITTSSDVTPPTASVVFPTAKSRTSADNVIVRGTAADTESAVASVRVNGVEAVSTDGFVTWSAQVPLTPGDNAIAVDAQDRALNRSSSTTQAAVVRNAPIAFVESLAFDAGGTRVLAADSEAAVLLSVELGSGLRTIVSKNTSLAATNSFRSPGAMALEPDGKRALVFDRGASAILRVDLGTGARTVVSGQGLPNHLNEWSSAFWMSADFASNRAYVVHLAPPAIYSVDLATGVRTILSDATTPNGTNLFPTPLTADLDKAHNRLLVGDNSTSVLYTVDLDTGARSILSSDTVPNATNPLSFIAAIAVDPERNRALLAQPNTRSIVAVDLDTGARTVVSSYVLPNSANPLYLPRALTLDAAGKRLLIADAGSRALLAMDLVSGVRTLLSAN